MPHPFFKRAFSTDGLPSKIGEKVYEKIQKTAHHLWGVETENGKTVISRNHEDSVVPDKSRKQEFQMGDVVLILSGEKKIAANVLSHNGSNLTVEIDGFIYDIDDSMVE